MTRRRKVSSTAVLAGAALLLFAWAAQAQQEPPRGNDPPGAFQDASSTDLSPLCFPAKWPQVLFRAEATDPADPTVIHLVPRMAVVLGVLLILVLHLSALIVWPIGAMVRRAGSRPHGSGPRGFPRLTAGAVIALSVGFWWWVRASLDVVLPLLMIELPDVVSRLVFLELHAAGQMDWVGPGQLRWLAEDVVSGTASTPRGSCRCSTSRTSPPPRRCTSCTWRSAHGARSGGRGSGALHYSIVAITLAWYPFHLYALGFIL